MSTNINGVIVPECPNGSFPENIELCHSFTANFIIQRFAQQRPGRNNVPYIVFQEGCLEVIIRMAGLQVVPQGQPIQAGDVITMPLGDRNNPDRYNHSMVAVDQNNWIGSNNFNTFNLAYNKINADFLNLYQRSLVPLHALRNVGVNFDQQTHTLRIPNDQIPIIIYRN